jgi:hypothetical protein
MGGPGEAPHGIKNQEAYTWLSGMIGMRFSDCGLDNQMNKLVRASARGE